MKIIATISRSAGNESVGEMWDETAIFEDGQPLADVMQWASDRVCSMVSNKPHWTERFKEYPTLQIKLTPAQGGD